MYVSRDRFADLLKGYACLLVVFGHVIIGLRTSSSINIPFFMPLAERFIWSFHIDLFMFLSGYVYSITGGWQRKGSRLKFLGGKLLDLGLPYFVFSAVYIVVNHFTPNVNNPSALSDILRLPYRPVAQYWFLLALFWLFVIWTLLSKFMPNCMITAVTFSVFLICKIFKVNLFFLDSSFNCALAFGLGTCLKSIPVKRIPIALRTAVIPIHIVSSYFILSGKLKDIILVDDFLTVLGIFSSVCFISLLSEIKFADSLLQYICRYSFPIYLLHTFFTAALRIVLLRFNIDNYLLHVILGTAVGTVLPIAAAKITSLTPYLDFFFYPSHSVKRIKSTLK